VTVMQPLNGQQGVFLRTAEDEPGDDVHHLHD